MKAKIAEIFEGIQGEGIYTGIRQVFIRFYGCNLSCKFCDTRLNSYREFDSRELLKRIRSFDIGYHSVSLTGGEPLLQSDFLIKFLPKLKKRVYLETNGTLPEKLNQAIDQIDIVAVDIKIPSSTGLRDFWDEHTKFLEIASKKEVFIKVVICKSTKSEDIRRAIKLIANFNKNIPFILQPNSFEMGKELTKKLIDFQDFCCHYLSYVRVIPQIHKFLGLR